MLKKTVLFIFFVFPVVVSSQLQKIDSLKKCLTNEKSEKEYNTLTLLSEEYSYSDLKTAMIFAKKAFVVAKNLKSDKLLANSYNTIGNTFQYNSNLDSAIIYHKKALQLRIKIKDSLGIADSFNNIGTSLDQMGQFSEALNNYVKSVYYYEKKKDFGKQAMVDINIGVLFKNQKNYKKTLEYYKNAYDLYAKINDKTGITIVSGNLGSVYINFGKFQEALKYSEIAKNGYKNLGHESYLGYPISTIAIVYDSLHQYEKANLNYIEAINNHIKYENFYEVSDVSNTYANCLIKQKKYEKSIYWSKIALENAQKSKTYYLLINSYNTISKANAKLGNFTQAYYYSNLYNIGKDSLFSIEKTKSINELETKYQTVKKEKLITQNKADAKQKNTIILAGSIVAVLVIIIIFFLYRQQKIKNNQQEQEFELQNAILKIESQDKLQEQRLTISRDLHDNIGAQLTFIISSIDTIKMAFDITNDKLDRKLSNISNFTQATIIELRDTIWAMNSSEIGFEDLISRIYNFIENAKLATEKIDFNVQIEEKVKHKKLTSVEGMNIYRTIQEAINNALKYAKASQISIDINDVLGRTSIKITDNGIGFNPETVAKGNGLKNMQKRMSSIDGTIEILSNTNSGTTVILEIK
ncbi:tetratricopeptide repeat protein [Flavobacterium sp.]|jgi:signal transduction histidine kinase|uniref:tetratricopeptide repeat-containing sensor histidine kinase n=1 Tax=Flavobacterium sp. TaxID=239 RepID=UPI0037BEA411